MITFNAQLKEFKVRNQVDLSQMVRVTLDTDAKIAAELQEFGPEDLLIVTIKHEKE